MLWPGKLSAIFSNTAKQHMYEIQTEKHVIQQSSAHTHTQQNSVLSVDTVPMLCKLLAAVELAKHITKTTI